LSSHKYTDEMIFLYPFLLAITLVDFPSEACFTFPPPPPTPTPTPTPTPAPPAPTTTTAPKYKCPIGGETSKGVSCIDNNILPDGIKSAVDNVLLCNKECVDYKDSECKFWTYTPARKNCFLLSSCVKDDGPNAEGLVSGEKGCEVPSKNFTITNLIAEDITDCKIDWEPTDVCPQETVAEIKTLKSNTVTYFTAPPPIGCTKITKVECTWGSVKCATSGAIDVPIPNLYVKTKLSAPKECEIANTPKNLF